MAKVIAGLIDGEVERRRPVSQRDWVAAQLGRATGELTELRRFISGFERVVQLTALGQLLHDHPPTALDGAEPFTPPVLAPPLRSDLPERPDELTAAWRQLEPLGCPVGVGIELDYRDIYAVTWFVPNEALPHFHETLPTVLRDLEASVAAKLRGGSYRVVREPMPGIEPLALTAPGRDELVLPDELWRLLDEDLHRLFRHAALLLELGLGVDRGVLLHGPPGTGKTDLLRVIASELAGSATVLIPDASIAKDHLDDLYRLAALLRPALVLLDDIDLIVGSERSGGALIEFLHAIDGAASLHEGIITLASTNHLQSLDDAAKRPARFDRIIEVPAPPATGRERILARYLGRFGDDIDIASVAGATEGATGAHLRELVRQAILTTDARPTTDALLAAASGLGLYRPNSQGQYL